MTEKEVDLSDYIMKYTVNTICGKAKYFYLLWNMCVYYISYHKKKSKTL